MFDAKFLVIEFPDKASMSLTWSLKFCISLFITETLPLILLALSEKTWFCLVVLDGTRKLNKSMYVELSICLLKDLIAKLTSRIILRSFNDGRFNRSSYHW